MRHRDLYATAKKGAVRVYLTASEQAPKGLVVHLGPRHTRFILVTKHNHKLVGKWLTLRAPSHGHRPS